MTSLDSNTGTGKPETLADREGRYHAEMEGLHTTEISAETLPAL